MSGCSDTLKALTLMFDRPLEPLFVPKGPNGEWVFEVPDAYLKSRYRKISDKLRKKFAKKDAKKIIVKNISLPDLTIPLILGRTDSFSLFLPKHKEIAAKLIEIFMSLKTCQDLVSVAAYCRDRLNPYLFNYALSVALLHRTDTRDVAVPSFLNSFPGRFIDCKIFVLARQEASIIPNEVREPIIIPVEFTANSREPEQSVAYFREDIGINLHHWHWHLVYPAQASDISIVNKDRRGELFYYMHHQVMARFNTERFSNGLSRVKAFPGFDEKMAEAYFPKLVAANSGRTWPARLTDINLFDIDRPSDRFALNKGVLQIWLDNIKDAIAKGFVVDADGNKIILDEKKGIDVLGNVVEASLLSPDRFNYGDLHNMGHIFIAFCHDPQGKYLESFGVMGDTATSMRDPIFYRWHTLVNNIFLSHKVLQPPYSVSQLDNHNITITDLNLMVPNKVVNELYTFWEQSDVDISRGLDFSPRGHLPVRFTHLQHENFIYTIHINNPGQRVFGTIRLFLLPKFDDEGVLLTFEEQRNLAIELDKFKVALNSGPNVVNRTSTDSSVTIPYEQTFRNMDPNRVLTGAALDQSNFCGCGWPQHMLIPKGTTEGMPFDLFAMVSKYEDDNIVQDTSSECNQADSYCGVLNKLYPDKRSMGYPFDRVPRAGVTTLNNFLTPNMATQEVTVLFTDRTVVRPAPPPNPPPYNVVKNTVL